MIIVQSFKQVHTENNNLQKWRFDVLILSISKILKTYSHLPLKDVLGLKWIWYPMKQDILLNELNPFEIKILINSSIIRTKYKA